MKRYTKRLVAALFSFKDFVFPLFCVSCSVEGAILCPSCVQDMSRIDQCKNDVCAIWQYAQGSVISELITLYKYQYVEHVLKDLSVQITEYCRTHTHMRDFSGVIPVPLHSKRYAERGFNQAMQISKIVSDALNIPIISALTRLRYTSQQAKLDMNERRKNVKNAFHVVKDLDLRGSYLLVDDVYTSGATMSACIDVLRENGVHNVSSFVLARG